MSREILGIMYSLTSQSSRKPSSAEAAADVDDLVRRIAAFFGDAPTLRREPSGYTVITVGPTTQTEDQLDEFQMLLEEEASRLGFKLVVETLAR